MKSEQQVKCEDVCIFIALYSTQTHTHTLDANWIHTQQSYSVVAGEVSDRIKREKK